MTANAESNDKVRVVVRPLQAGEMHRDDPSGGAFTGVLDQIRGTRLTIRAADESCSPACGMLVEVETPEHVYLGEIKYSAGGRIFIDFEHELQKSALEALRKVWS